MSKLKAVNRSTTDTLAITICQFANGRKSCFCANQAKDQVCVAAELMARGVRRFCQLNPLPE